MLCQASPEPFWIICRNDGRYITAKKKTTLPRACARCKGALTPPLSVTDRSLTRIDGHSKHLFQTHVFDLFVSLCNVNIGTPLKSSRGEKDKSLVMPWVDSAWLEHQRLVSLSSRKPQATKSNQTRSTQSVVSLCLKYNRLGTHTPIMSLGNTGVTRFNSNQINSKCCLPRFETQPAWNTHSSHVPHWGVTRFNSNQIKSTTIFLSKCYFCVATPTTTAVWKSVYQLRYAN